MGVGGRLKDKRLLGQVVEPFSYRLSNDLRSKDFFYLFNEIIGLIPRNLKISVTQKDVCFYLLYLMTSSTHDFYRPFRDYSLLLW